jgi:ribosomal protein S12 methylthiotransferase accessory factor
MGKGRDASSARVSAMMEAIERISAEPPVPGNTKRGSYSSLTKNQAVIDPRLFALPDDTDYHPDQRYTWARSRDLLAGQPVWMVSDLVITPPVEGVLLDVDTNGLASGNTHLEAVVHAICEVIERDAWSQQEFATLFADEYTPGPERRAISLSSIPGEAGRWIDRIQSAGLELTVHDITSDVGVATCQALLTDPSYVTSTGINKMRFQGLGTHPSAHTAMLRAITEAVQARLSFIQGARDDYNIAPSTARSWTKTKRAFLYSPREHAAFSEIPSADHHDLLDDYSFLIARLRSIGIKHVIATDLTDPEMAIPVVRVRIPQLSCFIVNRRRVDWRCLRHLL